MATIVPFHMSESDLRTIINDFFLVLSPTEKTVITKRFALDDNPRQTLESIGSYFDVTRERIRQIENNAIKKLQRNVMNSHLRKVSEMARNVLQEAGGMMMTDRLISKVLQILNSNTPYSGNVVKLALRLDKNINEVKRDFDFHPFHHFTDISISDIQKTYKMMKLALKEKKDVSSFASIYKDIKDSIRVSRTTMESIARSSPKILEVEDGYIGIAKWRHINPKSIRDKAILIFKKHKKPLHFIELSNLIGEFGDRKHVTVQAVHNDLIRYEDFVLVGRGMYALSQWGIPAGTVMDIIAKILKEQGPMKRQALINEVKKFRDVKNNTISLNLQKSPAFVRVGRAVYAFDETQWSYPEGGRGRAYLKKEEHKAHEDEEIDE